MGIKIEVFKTLDDEDKKIKVLNKDISRPCFRMVLIGSTGTGKTNFIKHLIFNEYKNYFDEIYIFIGSSDDRDEYERIASCKKYRLWNKKKQDLYKSKKKCLIEKMTIMQEVSAEQLKDLYDELEQEQNETGKKIRSLWVFDDQITSNLFRRKGSMGMIDQIFIKGRHINLSCIISTQYYTALSQNIRGANTSQVVLFSGLSDKELKKIAEEQAQELTKEEFINLYRIITEKKFSALIINTKEPPKTKYQNEEFDLIELSD